MLNFWQTQLSLLFIQLNRSHKYTTSLAVMFTLSQQARAFDVDIHIQPNLIFQVRLGADPQSGIPLGTPLG
jgi:hypothetical protein